MLRLDEGLELCWDCLYVFVKQPRRGSIEGCNYFIPAVINK
jgi:hypothetical protein